MTALRAALLALLLAATPALAVQPDEMLADPVLEARARDISRQIRCPVCQGESIDDSNAAISRDLRIIIRERLTAGDSDEQVIDFLVDRYGEFVLFNPRVSGSNLILWLAGPAMLLVAGGIAFATFRRKPTPEDGLSADEQARLEEILKK
ncbi:cytochrome c-type biogenesis protein [Pseudogemmobacter blasticus]|uniref:Cytochrome c-type biogenesis protein n=1 Tax=Fuscovulum blasticum DSM 2131 TaxID=1188250 RepID=A0A2T4J7G6_FUSBL|nr:cytochrome c-type biogenesis protein [Fuscovulum blasticum]AWD20755.1 cytochrome C biogenesis protein CcdA [Fuscovulum blasticum]PTE13831.1 cytochrome C biogenesis protein CcdA [Fuscovulum blasticum DSM 2131]